MEFVTNLKELEQLEDKDLAVKQRIKKDHKINPDDVFYRFKLTFNNYLKVGRTKNKEIVKGSYIVVPTLYGPEIGIVQGIVNDINDVYFEDEIFDIIRVASNADIEKYRLNLKKNKKAFDITKEKIVEHGLEMKLINVHYFLEDSKILFNFTADGRIDFRELVKELASIFKTRIELRQIGVRDECRIMSGCGHCGRTYCCSSVINHLDPITIKMAKEQNITLNSLKISGACGRLLCCLAYENESYIEEKKNYPDEGAKINFNDKWATVIEINIQSKSVKLASDENTFFSVPVSVIEYNREKRIGRISKKIEI
jgi:cell fate regulator YaaT (PSP1 superfamily)